MKEFVEKLIGRLEEKHNEVRNKYLKGQGDPAVLDGNMRGLEDAIEIVNQLADEYENGHFGCNTNGEHEKCTECPLFDCQSRNKVWFPVEDKSDSRQNKGWIACSDKLPPQPKENPLLENDPLEMYLVSLSNTDFPFRAFWNGKHFTDGFAEVDAIAWMPLPAPYQKGE